MTASRLVPAAERIRSTNSLISFSGTIPRLSLSLACGGTDVSPVRLGSDARLSTTNCHPPHRRLYSRRQTRQIHRRHPHRRSHQIRRHHIHHPDHHPCCSTACPIAVRTRIQIRRCLARLRLPEISLAKWESQQRRKRISEAAPSPLQR